ncbi:MAG: hypothetical protein JST54_05760 [Deltaproteobacteria bacterium]|nr:hypothetical protein [Deltaproteobacteria bacterium]
MPVLEPAVVELPVVEPADVELPVVEPAVVELVDVELPVVDPAEVEPVAVELLLAVVEAVVVPLLPALEPAVLPVVFDVELDVAPAVEAVAPVPDALVVEFVVVVLLALFVHPAQRADAIAASKSACATRSMKAHGSWSVELVAM